MEAGTLVRAAFEFLPSVSEELTLFTGDVIEVLGVVDEFWLLGNKDGVTGQFPSTFVEEVTIPSSEPEDPLYVCVNDFCSTQPDALSLTRGDVLVGQAGESAAFGESWLCGRDARGARGVFPASCVKELTLSRRSRQLSERSARARTSDLPAYALGQARALMSLRAQLNEELDFREGDAIVITGLPEPGWFEGELDGRRGVFPEGFVELLGPLRSPREPAPCPRFGDDRDHAAAAEEDAAEDVEPEERRNESTPQVDAEAEGAAYGVALYDFRAMEPGELDFDVGDRIRVLDAMDDGWLEGELRGRRGIFPHRFVQIDDSGLKMAKGAGRREPEEEEEEESTFQNGSRPSCPNGDDLNATSYEDHTIWDLDYFERGETNAAPEESGRESRCGGGPRRPRGRPPARPRLPPPPPRPGRPARSHVGPVAARGNARPLAKFSPSLTLPGTRSGWSKDGPAGNGLAAAAAASRSATLGRALTSLVEDPRRKNQWRRCGSNGPAPSAGGDLEAKLSQQLFEFEKSLTARPGRRSPVSRHFSIVGYSDESDVVRGSRRSPGRGSASSFSESRGALRPPPPRPRAVGARGAPASGPARPALRPPPPRPAAHPPLNNEPVFLAADEPTRSASDPTAEGPADPGDPAETEAEPESPGRGAREDAYGLSLRLRELEDDMEAYARAAEELRAMLEEDGEETARAQVMENLEFCNYALETLALEQQHLQGQCVLPFGHLRRSDEERLDGPRERRRPCRFHARFVSPRRLTPRSDEAGAETTAAAVMFRPLPLNSKVGPGTERSAMASSPARARARAVTTPQLTICGNRNLL